MAAPVVSNPPSERWAFANPSVPIHFVQKEGSATCLASSVASVVDIMGLDAKPLFDALLKVPMDNFFVRMSVKTIKSFGFGCKCLPKRSFDPLTYRSCASEYFVLAKVKTGKCQHVVVFYKDMIIEPSLKSALKISDENLQDICDGDYKGIAWAVRVTPKPIRDKLGRNKRLSGPCGHSGIKRVSGFKQEDLLASGQSARSSDHSLAQVHPPPPQFYYAPNEPHQASWYRHDSAWGQPHQIQGPSMLQQACHNPPPNPNHLPPTHSTYEQQHSDTVYY
jgi:hypothetical protein